MALCCETVKFKNINYKTMLQQWKNKTKSKYSGTEHLVDVLEKLSTTSVVYFRSERELEFMHLYGVENAY